MHVQRKERYTLNNDLLKGVNTSILWHVHHKKSRDSVSSKNCITRFKIFGKGWVPGLGYVHPENVVIVNGNEKTHFYQA